jgi:hypothetical protein
MTMRAHRFPPHVGGLATPAPAANRAAGLGALIACAILFAAGAAYASSVRGTVTVARVVSVSSPADGGRVTITATVVRCGGGRDGGAADCLAPGSALRFLPDNPQEVLDANLQRGELVRLESLWIMGEDWASQSNRYEGRVPR